MTAFDDEFGALLVGQIATTFLYGLGTLQTYAYYNKYPRDGKELKIWVGIIWVIDTVNVALVCHGLYLLLYGNTFANPDNSVRDSGKRSFDISAGFNILVAILVQCFFVKRIFQLCDLRIRFWVTAVLVSLVLAHFALGSMAVVKVIGALSVHTARPLSTLSVSALTPYTVVAVVSDSSIAVALVLLLRTKRSAFESLNSIVNRAISFALSRCVLVSVLALIRLVTFVVIPQTMWFVATDFVMGKLYANSLLTMLNSRRLQPTYTIEPASGSSGETAVFSTVLDFSGPELTSTMASGMYPTYPPPQMRTDHENQGDLAKQSRLDSHYVPT